MVVRKKRKFEIGFKRQVVSEVETGKLSLSAAARSNEANRFGPRLTFLATPRPDRFPTFLYSIAFNDSGAAFLALQFFVAFL